MKLWLDDIRLPPEDFELWAQTQSDAITLLQCFNISHISFDHDLGLDSGSGYDVALWIEQHAHLGNLPPMTWTIHSANPVGRERIKAAMLNADKYWGKANSPHEHRWTRAWDGTLVCACGEWK